MQGFPVSSPTLPPTAALLDQLQLAYVLIDQRGLLVDANETLLRLTGYTSAEVLGRAYHEVFSPLSQREQRQQELLHLLRE